MDFEQVVVIAEKVNYTEKTTMYSEELDFSTEKITTDFIKALQDIGYQICYYENPKNFLDNISLHKKDIVFATLWGGKHSRNKRSIIPAICEAYDIPFVGADAYVQSLCQDKFLTKLYLNNYGFCIPRAIKISNMDDLELLKSLDFFPCIIKPNDEACSIGISSQSKAFSFDEAKKISLELLSHYTPIIVEEFIGGNEISLCCAGSKHHLDILEAVEVRVNDQPLGDRIWAYDSKRISIGKSSRHIVTDSFPEYYLKEAADLFYNLGKVDCCRIDGKFQNGHFYIIEISPDCSLSKKCFMANAFYHNNYTYSEMLDRLIFYACQDYS